MLSPKIEKTLNSKEAFILKDQVGPYFNPNWHFHPEFQISLIVEGKGTRFVGDHVETFEEGDLVITGPNLPHLWRSDEAYFTKGSRLSTRGIVIYFDHEILGESLLEKEEFYRMNKLVEKSVRGMSIYGDSKEEIVELMMQIPNEKGFKRIIKLLEILDILANCKEYNLLASPGYSNVNKGVDVDKIRIVYDYVMKNFRTKISLDEVSDLLNMTTTSFCRYFKPRANKTFSSFVNEIRIGHARKLLLEDNYNISEICYECGFGTLSNFNRQFKSVTNLRPLEYRKLYLHIKTNIS